MAADVRHLRRIELFRDLSDRDLDALGALAQRRRYGRGELILQAGDERDGLFGVEEGAARLYRLSAEGHEITLATFDVGDIFGLSFLSPRVGAVGAFEATADGTVVAHISRQHVGSFVAAHPDVALSAFDLVGYRLASMGDLVEELALHDAWTRVAHVLPQMARDAGGLRVVRASHREIAARVGTREDEVTRALRHLRELGLVGSIPHRRGVVLRDVEALARYRPARGARGPRR
ncbi:MAG: Crp/Fnr family transcriptional regulator [Chloroflexi bacterium]|nr:Crp/Fnr family transcriptional regulator [Chloroflexota bacterium]